MDLLRALSYGFPIHPPHSLFEVDLLDRPYDPPTYMAPKLWSDLVVVPSCVPRVEQDNSCFLMWFYYAVFNCIFYVGIQMYTVYCSTVLQDAT